MSQDGAAAEEEEEPARSYCVFERDRMLPRPTPGRPLAADVDLAARSRAPMPMATKIGFALWGVAALWWFAYYANWQGAFGLMDVKLMCIAVATSECELFQQRIARISAIPTYYPVFWWAGCIAMGIGLMQMRGGKQRTEP